MMLESPYDGVDDELKLRTGNAQEPRKAFLIDRLEKEEKAGAMLRVFLEVFIDHLQRTLLIKKELETSNVRNC
jgi:hypothetical protein